MFAFVSTSLVLFKDVFGENEDMCGKAMTKASWGRSVNRFTESRQSWVCVAQLLDRNELAVQQYWTEEDEGHARMVNKATRGKGE